MPSAEILEWAASAFPKYDPEESPAPHRLPGAGSDRRLYRLFLPAGSVVLVENPSSPTEGPNENDSFVYLSGHLRSHGVSAPAVHAYSRERGAYIMEDLGDDDLFGKVRIGLSEGELLDLYRKGLSLLARMQVDAVGGLDSARLHSPPQYDRDLMLSRESGYFQRELLGSLLGFGEPPAALQEEFRRLAEGAGKAGSDFFLHRDFQSRNLKFHRGELRVIDFQGARLGPPQYDLAAFLLDPYVELSPEIREALLEDYLGHFLHRSGLDRSLFLRDFPFVAAHRLMQALGAYAFLGSRRGKRDFLGFISPALRLLREIQGTLPAGAFPELDRAVALAQERWEERPEAS